MTKVVNLGMPAGTPKQIYDATANDSDKSFTVPAGKVWDLTEVDAEIVCTATVGNRTLQIIITDGTNNRFLTIPTAAITASQQGRAVLTNAASSTTAFGMRRLDNSGNDNQISTHPLPKPYYLPAGWVIRVYDSAAIDAAADDLTVQLRYTEYDV